MSPARAATAKKKGEQLPPTSAEAAGDARDKATNAKKKGEQLQVRLPEEVGIRLRLTLSTQLLSVLIPEVCGHEQYGAGRE